MPWSNVEWHKLTKFNIDPKPLIPRNKHRPQGVSLGLSDFSKVSIPIVGDAHTTMLKRELHYYANGCPISMMGWWDDNARSDIDQCRLTSRGPPVKLHMFVIVSHDVPRKTTSLIMLDTSTTKSTNPTVNLLEQNYWANFYHLDLAETAWLSLGSQLIGMHCYILLCIYLVLIMGIHYDIIMNMILYFDL